MGILEILISHFFVRGKPQTRYRDKTTGQFVSGVMFRTTFGVKQMPVNHKYYGVTCYFWSKEPLDHAEVDNCYALFCKELHSYLGYGADEWWFSVFQQTNWQQNLKPTLIGTWRFKVDRKGMTLREWSGNY